MKAPKLSLQSLWPFRSDGSVNPRSQMAGPLGERVPVKAPAARPAQPAMLPTRKDVVVGPDGRWATKDYVPQPVYTKKEPKP